MRAFSDELGDWLRGDGPKTLGALSDTFAEKGFAVTIMLLMFVPALPVPTGGITHVFEAITVLLGLEMVLGRTTIWLPDRLRRRDLGRTTTDKAIPFIVRRIKQFERHSRPRGVRLFASRTFIRWCGVWVIVFTLGSAVAPPFSGLDTLPAAGVVAIALAIILEDVVLIGVGAVLGITGIALILTIGAALARIIRGWF